MARFVVGAPRDGCRHVLGYAVEVDPAQKVCSREAVQEEEKLVAIKGILSRDAAPWEYHVLDKVRVRLVRALVLCAEVLEPEVLLFQYALLGSVIRSLLLL